MKKILCVSLVATLTLGVAHSATINWGSTKFEDSFIQDSAGAALRLNSFVRIGFFNLTDLQITALATPTSGNIATLDANFVEWDSSRIGVGSGNAPGAFEKSASRLLNTFAPGAGSQLFMWFLKSTSDGSSPLSISTGFEQAIVYRNKTIDADWAVPASDLAFPVGPDTSDIGAPGGALRSGAVVLAGSFVPVSAGGASFNGVPSSAVQLQAVPEPTSVFLIAAGAAGLMMRRRRQS